jgi:hypothetical protein
LNQNERSLVVLARFHRANRYPLRSKNAMATPPFIVSSEPAILVQMNLRQFPTAGAGW